MIACSYLLFGVMSVALYVLSRNSLPMFLKTDVPDLPDTLTSSNSTTAHHESLSISHPIQLPTFIRSVTSAPSKSPIHIADALSIRKARLQPSPRCPNSTYYLLPTTPSDHNYAPYYFRCRDVSHQSTSHRQQSFSKKPWLDEGFLSKELFYDHVFKAAGSTILGNLGVLIKRGILANLTKLGIDYFIRGDRRKDNFQRNGPWTWIHPVSFYHFIDNNTISFSFVRDPVDKFLSAFYEIHYRYFVSHQRQHLPLGVTHENIDKSGIQIMRLWIDELLSRKRRNRVNSHLKPKSTSKRRRLKNQWVDHHLSPNMQFLQDEHGTSNIPFNFIGDLKNLAVDLPQILEPFILDEALRRNHTKFMELVKKRRVQDVDYSDPTASKFRIDRSELSDEDVSSICDLYYLDYLCLPFDIPPECDLDKLIEDHYGNDVEYNDCY